MPMGIISMDLMGPFEVMSRGNQYALTVICVLNTYVISIPLVDKSAHTVVTGYLEDIYCICRGCKTILSNNGSELRNLLFSKVAIQLGIKHMYSS